MFGDSDHSVRDHGVKRVIARGDANQMHVQKIIHLGNQAIENHRAVLHRATIFNGQI